MQNIYFGVARADRLSDQRAVHIEFLRVTLAAVTH
jgi:hypothetical protein